MAVIYRLNYAINTGNKGREEGRAEAVSHASYRSGLAAAAAARVRVRLMILGANDDNDDDDD